MGILNNLFKWFSVKNKYGEEVDLGYVLEGEPKNTNELEKLFHAFRLNKYFQSIKPLIRNKIDLILKPTDEQEIRITQSKIGGKPDLKNAIDWPKTELNKSMSFIAQLNCGEVSKHDKTGLFPKAGLLSFFYCADQEAWGFDPKDKNRFKVLYTEEFNNLNKIDFPIDLEEFSIFRPNTINFNESLSIPTWQEDCIEGLIHDDDSDNYFEVSNGSENQIFGYANCVQNTMELECQLVTHGLYCGSPEAYHSTKGKELERGKDDWVLLLQLDSEEEKTGMMWGDVGKLYFWIRKQDLSTKNFDKAWFCLQCH